MISANEARVMMRMANLDYLRRYEKDHEEILKHIEKEITNAVKKGRTECEVALYIHDWMKLPYMIPQVLERYGYRATGWVEKEGGIYFCRIFISWGDEDD